MVKVKRRLATSEERIHWPRTVDCEPSCSNRRDIMAIVLFMAALALRGSFPEAGGRAQIVTDAVAAAVGALGSSGAAAVFLAVGAALAALAMRFGRE